MKQRLPNLWLPDMPLELTGADHFTFICPLCGNIFRQREKYEPMCTGPTWLDEHDPTVMVRRAAYGQPSAAV